MVPHRQVARLHPPGRGRTRRLARRFVYLARPCISERRVASTSPRPPPYIAAWHQAPVHVDRDLAWLHLEVFSVLRTKDKLKYLAGSDPAWRSGSTTSPRNRSPNDCVPRRTANLRTKPLGARGVLTMRQGASQPVLRTVPHSSGHDGEHPGAAGNVPEHQHQPEQVSPADAGAPVEEASPWSAAGYQTYRPAEQTSYPSIPAARLPVRSSPRPHRTGGYPSLGPASDVTQTFHSEPETPSAGYPNAGVNFGSYIRPRQPADRDHAGRRGPERRQRAAWSRASPCSR